MTADPVVSPADTIRRCLTSKDYDEFADGIDALDALLAVGERDRQQIARLTEAAKAADTAMRWHYEDVVPAAEVPDEATAFEVAIALVRAVLAGEEDADNG